MQASAKAEADRTVAVPFEWPDYCKELMPLIEPREGEPVWGTQRRWEVARVSVNKRITWCNGYAVQRDKAMSPGAQ